MTWMLVYAHRPNFPFWGSTWAGTQYPTKG